MRNRLLAVLLSAATLAGCGMPRQFAELKKEQEQAAAVFERELGVRPEVSFNYLGDHLVLVNVMFEARSVQDFQVRDLEARVRKATVEAFSATPEQTVISLRSSGPR